MAAPRALHSEHMATFMNMRPAALQPLTDAAVRMPPPTQPPQPAPGLTWFDGWFALLLPASIALVSLTLCLLVGGE